MDYRLLLKKYIHHVGECEGTTFIPTFSDSFTDEENAELDQLDYEDLTENAKNHTTQYSGSSEGSGEVQLQARAGETSERAE